jgi:hypothetical protein
MSDEFWDLIGSEKENEPAIWRCRRFLDDCFTDDTETVPVYDVVCGHAVTNENDSTDHIKDQCNQCGLYRVLCSCGKGMLDFCMLYKGRCPRASR